MKRRSSIWFFFFFFFFIFATRRGQGQAKSKRKPDRVRSGSAVRRATSSLLLGRAEIGHARPGRPTGTGAVPRYHTIFIYASGRVTAAAVGGAPSRLGLGATNASPPLRCLSVVARGGLFCFSPTPFAPTSPASSFSVNLLANSFSVNPWILLSMPAPEPHASAAEPSSPPQAAAAAPAPAPALAPAAAPSQAQQAPAPEPGPRPPIADTRGSPPGSEQWCPPRLRYISAQEAADIDAKLMGPDYAFSIDQLMELAGLACAQTVLETYPIARFDTVLVLCGPGNQGGDGLVAARHLHHFGYEVAVWYPKAKKDPLFDRLKKQVEALHIHFVPTDEFEDGYRNCDVVLDCMFGFSFKGLPRSPFKEVIDLLGNESVMEFEYRRQKPSIVSIDLPSGWDVDQGNVHNLFVPQVVLSLTTPKAGLRGFPGQHFVGGRFVPEDLDREFDLFLPAFPGASQIVDITSARDLDPSEVTELRSLREQGSVSSLSG